MLTKYNDVNYNTISKFTYVYLYVSLLNFWLECKPFARHKINIRYIIFLLKQNTINDRSIKSNLQYYISDTNHIDKDMYI